MSSADLTPVAWAERRASVPRGAVGAEGAEAIEQFRRVLRISSQARQIGARNSHRDIERGGRSGGQQGTRVRTEAFARLGMAPGIQMRRHLGRDVQDLPGDGRRLRGHRITCPRRDGPPIDETRRQQTDRQRKGGRGSHLVRISKRARRSKPDLTPEGTSVRRVSLNSTPVGTRAESDSPDMLPTDEFLANEPRSAPRLRSRRDGSRRRTWSSPGGCRGR